MLPFMEPKKIASVIVAKRKPSGEMEPKHEESEMDPGLMAAAEDLIRAMHAKDAEHVARAFQAAFDVCESYPHEENDGGDAA